MSERRITRWTIEGVTKILQPMGLLYKVLLICESIGRGNCWFWLNGNVMEETDYSEGEIIGEARLYDERGKESQIKKKKYGWYIN